MTTTPPVPPPPAYPPTPGLVTTWSSLADRQQHTAVPAAPTFQQPIPVLPDDHHHAVDWPRVRRALRTCITPASCTGLALSPACARFALPLAEQHGLGAVVGLGFMAAVYAVIAQATGRIPSSLTTVVLVATAAGTLELAPVAIAAHLMEN